MICFLNYNCERDGGRREEGGKGREGGGGRGREGEGGGGRERVSKIRKPLHM